MPSLPIIDIVHASLDPYAELDHRAVADIPDNGRIRWRRGPARTGREAVSRPRPVARDV